MWKKIRELLFDSSIYGASGVLTKLVGFLLLPLYTRYITEAEYGALAMFAVIALFFVPVANLGMTNAIFRKFALAVDEEEKQITLSTGVLSVLTSSCCLGLITYSTAHSINSFLTDNVIYLEVCKIAILNAILSSIGAIPLVILRAQRRVKTLFVINIVKLIATMSTAIILVVGLDDGMYGLVLGSFVGGSIAILVGISLTMKGFQFRFSKNTWKTMLDYGVPFLPHQLFIGAILILGQYFIRLYLGLEELGVYSIAVRFAMPVAFVVTAIQKAWVPFKFEIYAQNDDPGTVLSSMVTYYVAAMSYLWIGVSCWAPELIRLTLPTNYHSATYLIALVGAIPLSKGLFFMFGSGFGLKQNTKAVPFVSFGGLIAVLLVSLALIPSLEAQGAAIASIVGWLTMARLLFAASQNLFKINYDWGILGPIALAASGIVVAGYLLQDHQNVERLTLSIIASVGYPIFLITLMSYSKTESARIRKTLKILQLKFLGSS